MSSLPPDAISVLTDVVVSTHLSGFISWLSEVLQDPRLQGTSSGTSRGSQNSTLPSNEIPRTIPAESVLPASTVSADRSVQETAPRHESKSVHFEDPAVPSGQDGNFPLSGSASDTGILKNGLGDTHPGEGIATRLPPQVADVPAADMGINRAVKWVASEAGSVASDKPLERATRPPGVHMVDIPDDVSLASYRSDQSRYGNNAQTRPQNPHHHAYSSLDEVQSGGGQTSRRAASPPLDVFQEGAYDTTSVVSDTSRHQPGRLSPIEEVHYVENHDADQDDASDLNGNNVGEAAATPRTSARSLRHTRSLRDLGGREKRFDSGQRNNPYAQPPHEADILAAQSNQQQTETPLEHNDPVAKDHSVNGTDVLSQLRETYSELSNQMSRLQSAISQLESIVATMTSIFDSFLSTRSSRPEDRTADASDGYLNESSPSFQLPTDPLPDDAQNNQPAVANGAVNGDAPLASGFHERPGSPVLSIVSAAPAEGTPPAEVRKGGRTGLLRRANSREHLEVSS